MHKILVFQRNWVLRHENSYILGRVGDALKQHTDVDIFESIELKVLKTVEIVLVRQA